MAEVKRSYFELVVGFTHGARVVNVDRHLSPFLRGDKLLSTKKRRFTWGHFSGEETLRDPEELHERCSVAPPGCLKTAPVRAGNLEYGIFCRPSWLAVGLKELCGKNLGRYQRFSVGWRYQNHSDLKWPGCSDDPRAC